MAGAALGATPPSLPLGRENGIALAVRPGATETLEPAAGTVQKADRKRYIIVVAGASLCEPPLSLPLGEENGNAPAVEPRVHRMPDTTAETAERREMQTAFWRGLLCIFGAHAFTAVGDKIQMLLLGVAFRVKWC